MSTPEQALGEVRQHRGGLDASGLRVAVVAARFNQPLVERLVTGALETLVQHGARPTDLHVAWTPGSFEIPVVLGRLASTDSFDALVAVGVVVRGETPHFDYIAGTVARGASRVSLEHGVPVAFGILTTDTWDQAVARSGGKQGNKGSEAARAAIETATLLDEL